MDVVKATEAVLEPAYVALHRAGELKRRANTLWGMMEQCRLCPRECGSRRLSGVVGKCGATAILEIASYHPHFGEEEPLVRGGGSGTIFFCHCPMQCVFCQNWDISHAGEGNPATIGDLADMMLDLQAMGCRNINLVTPTHYVAGILHALGIAAEKGLRLPLVYNTSGWERVEILALLDGIVDIYLPDFKFWDPRTAAQLTADVESYPGVVKAAILEMHRQVAVAKPAWDGLIRRGLMIRHLVLPNAAGGTKKILEWIAHNLPRDTYVNLMSQYRPAHEATEHVGIARRLRREEYVQAVQWAEAMGLTNLEIQGMPG